MEKLIRIIFIFAIVSIVLALGLFIFVLIMNVLDNFLSEEVSTLLSSQFIEMMMYLMLAFALLFAVLTLFFEVLLASFIGGKKEKSAEKKKLRISFVISIVSLTILFFFLFLAPNLLSLESFEESCRPTKTIKIEANMVKLRTIAAIHHEYSNNNSFFGLENNPEILPIKKHIAKCGGSDFVININPEGTEYCAKVKLPFGIDDWYCIDSTGEYNQYNNPKCSNYYYACE